MEALSLRTMDGESAIYHIHDEQDEEREDQHPSQHQVRLAILYGFDMIKYGCGEDTCLARN